MKYLGLTPFALYVLLFLGLPTLLAVVSGFVGPDDGFTLRNFAVLAEPAVLEALWASVWLSALTSVIAAVAGAVACYALTGLPENSLVRRVTDAAAGVLAQFGGVMLAFAFIATIGIQGVVTVVLRDQIGLDIYADGVWLYQLPGLILPYLFFQIPLMIIVFFPAMAALKPQWAEATATLGGSPRHFWSRVGLPVLAPSFIGSFLLLFANAFSSFATAAALISQGAQIMPLQIRAALISETGASRANTAGVLALSMLIVMAIIMIGYSTLMRRAARWQS